MRFSAEEKFKVREIKKKDVTAEEFFAYIAKMTSAEDRRGGVLLVGGVSPRDLAIRHAQAGLRLDNLPSYWSHAALILDWKEGARLENIIGGRSLSIPLTPTNRCPSGTG